MLPRSSLSRIQTRILTYPKRVLLLSGLAVALAIALGSGVEYRTSRADLVGDDDPDQRRWTELLDEYAGTEAVIACVEPLAGAAEASSLVALSDRLAEAFAGDPLVDSVFHRVRADWFRQHALYLLPAETLEQAVAAVERESRWLSRLEALRSFAAFNEILAERIETNLADSGSLADADERSTARLVDLLRAQRELVTDPTEVVERWLAEGPQQLAGALGPAGRASNGYLQTHDGRVYFLIVAPRAPAPGLRERRQLVAALRQRATEVLTGYPEFRVAFAGQPALVVEEMDTVRRDTLRTSLAAIVGVTLLTFLVFRWRTHSLLVLGALAAGVVWSLGAVRLELGYLNMITSSFVSTLVGVGVAYGIHPVSEYELAGAHTADPSSAVREAYHHTGSAVATAALTTSAAFFSILLMQFRGFAELGLVAGVGVLLCLLAALVTLPALLVLYGHRRARRDRGVRQGAAVDRFWGDRFADRICRRPFAVVVGAGLVTLASVWLALGLDFNSNVLDLLPRDAESASYQRRMALESDLSPLYNLVVADDLVELRRMRELALQEPSIARFESVLRFLPDEPVRSQRAVAELDRLVGDLELSPSSEPVDRERWVAGLVRLEDALAEALDAAFVAGLGETAAGLEEGLGEVESTREAVATAEPERLAAMGAEQQRLFDALHQGLSFLHEALAAEPPTLAGLPDSLRDRFVTRQGRFLGFLFPAGDVFSPPDLATYVQASKRVSADATGFPLLFSRMTARIRGGFGRAVTVGGLVVLAMLIVDFRNPAHALLAMVPLVLGAVWMLGAMRLVGISFNLANLVAVPLIIGVGIDNGVHVMHRVRLEGREGMRVVLRHTGRAILIASLTTMVGFGSLGLASHRGLSSLGVVLLLGVGACLVSSTVVLPNLLVVLGRIRR